MNTPSSTRSPIAGFPTLLRWSPLLLVVALLAACGGDPPTVCGEIGEVELFTKDSELIQPCFEDPEGEKLTLTTRSADKAIATSIVLGQAIRIKAVSPGSTTVTVTAEDPGGQTASMDIQVLVPNRAPRARGRLSDVKTMIEGVRQVIVNENFSDPDDQALVFSARSADPSVASADVKDSLKLIVIGTGLGTTTVTVVATDPGGLTAEREMEVSIVEPVMMFDDQFETTASLSDWVRNFASIASISGGRLYLYNLYSGWFGLADRTGLAVSDYVFSASVGRDTEEVVAGFMAIAPYVNFATPYAFFFLLGYGENVLGHAGDSNWRMATCCGWSSEGAFGGESDIVAEVGELNEIAMSTRRGRMIFTIDGEEMFDIDMIARVWPSILSTARLAMYGLGGATRQRGFWDWASLEAVDQAADPEAPAFELGPAEFEEFELATMSAPGAKIPTIEIRK